MNVELKQKIDEELDWLVSDGKKLIDSTWESIKKENVEKSQMRNLLEMAVASDSVKVLELFIQYQMGRKKLPRDFGNQLIQKITTELTNKANEISKNRSEHTKEVLLRIVRLYLGYMNRYFVYKVEVIK
ncbi:MAG: hypothetical protein L6282_19500 [Candidatus Methanoperedenaceae archaeon]|nr:hypothetical protein [Candidatus Methanoperedenaceae archaeon]